MLIRPQYLLLPVLSLCAAAQTAQAPHKPAPLLLTEFQQKLATDGSSIGTPFRTKTLGPWTNGTCTLKPGAVISGHVAAVEHKSATAKGSSFTLVFDQAECGGNPTPIHFTLYAFSSHPFNVNDPGAAPDSANLLGYNPGQMTSGHVSPDRDDSLEYAAGNNVRPNDSRRRLTRGQVNGLDKVTLEVGATPEGGSTMSTPKGDIRLDVRSQFILMETPHPTAP